MLGHHTIALIATDASGNTSSKKAVVVVVDNIAPTISADEITVELVNGTATITPDQIDNQSFDACGIESMTVTPHTFDCENMGQNEVLFTVEDVNGNLSSQKVLVNVMEINVDVYVEGLELNAQEENAEFQWLRCEDIFLPISGETGSSFLATESGNYAVVISKYGCSDTSACIELRTVGLEKTTFQNEIKLYPNPTTGNFSIDLSKAFGEVEVTISNTAGQIVSKRNYANIQVIQEEIDGAKGFYFVTISTPDNRKAIFKVLLQ